MRDHISPVRLVMTRVPKEVLEAQYKVFLPPMDSPKYTTSTFLQVFASKKGWKTGSGTPAEMHAARNAGMQAGKHTYVHARMLERIHVRHAFMHKHNHA